MKDVVNELNTLVDRYESRFAQIPDETFSRKPLPSKWSNQEVVGHLIDSAQNNLRRFIVGQYEPAPPKIIYDQDFWVSANVYQRMSKADIIMLWKLVNKRICQVLDQMPETNYTRTVDTGKEEKQLRTLEWLAGDYVKHMKHHINQIIPASFDIVYK